MIKEAIDRILSLAPADIRDLHGAQYSDKPLSRIKAPGDHKPETLIVHTLTGIRDFRASNEIGAYIHIVDHANVRLIGTIQDWNDNQRFVYAAATMDMGGFKFGQMMDLEPFIINLQSNFVPGPEVEDILDMLGNLASEQVKETKDDRFSQSIQVRVGIRMKEEVKVKNPILLKPWRTFREIEQPASNCILRLKEVGGNMNCGLFVADGNQWQLEAIKGIKEWIAAECPDIEVIA